MINQLQYSAPEHPLVCFHYAQLSQDYQIQEKLGEGTSSSVYRATAQIDEVALKIFKCSCAYAKEKKIYEKLSDTSDYVIKPVGFRDDANTIILPYYSGGSLYDNRALLKGDLSLLRNCAEQITYALQDIHEGGLVHGDLKPENILFTDRSHSKICLADLGLASGMGASTNESICTPWYRPPEDFIGAPIDGAFDTWSMACCLAELYIGTPLFPGTDEEIFGQIICRQGAIPPKMLLAGNRPNTRAMMFPPYLQPVTSFINGHGLLYGHDPIAVAYFSDFLGRCLTVDSSQRMTAFQAAAHPFFTHTTALMLSIPLATELEDREYLTLYDAMINKPIATFNLYEIQENGGFFPFLSHSPQNHSYYADIYSPSGTYFDRNKLFLPRDSVITI